MDLEKRKTKRPSDRWIVTFGAKQKMNNETLDPVPIEWSARSYANELES